MTDPILVLGASGGIGAALSRRLAARGCSLHLAGRNPAPLAALAEELGCGYTAADVAQPGAVAAIIAEAAPQARLGGLAYCIGSIVMKPLKAATAEDFIEAYRLNVVGAAEAVKQARQALAAARGAVVLFSSVAAGQGFANHAVIASAKAGVEGLTRSLAAELAPDIRVNCIAPSLTRTKLAAPITGNEAMAKAIAAQHPLKRLGEAEDIAALADFLLGPGASWITGQIMAADGGRSSLK